MLCHFVVKIPLALYKHGQIECQQINGENALVITFRLRGVKDVSQPLQVLTVSSSTHTGRTKIKPSKASLS